MKSIIVAAVLAFGLVGAAASAQGTQGAQEEPKEKKICRTDKSTGSLTRRTRVCMTEAEWRELNSKVRRGLEEMGQSASGGTAVANNPGPGGPGG